MKEKLIPGILAGALGILMLFFGIAFINVGANPFLAVAIGGIVLGASLIAVSVLTLLRLDERIPVLEKILPPVGLLAFPALEIIDIVVILAALGADNIAPTVWIMDILMLISAAGLLTFGILCVILDKPLFLRLRDLCLAVTLMILLLMLAFDQNGGINGLGEISVFEFASLLLFGGIAFFALRDSFFFARDKVTAYRPAREPRGSVEEDLPEEEPVDETAPEEPAPEEPAE